MACYASIHFSTLCIFNIDTRQQSLTANPESEQLTTENLVRFMLCTYVPLSPLPPDYDRSDKIDVIVHPIPQTLKSPQRIVPATKIITFFSPFLNCRLNDRLIEVFESLQAEAKTEVCVVFKYPVRHASSAGNSDESVFHLYFRFLQVYCFPNSALFSPRHRSANFQPLDLGQWRKWTASWIVVGCNYLAI